MWIGIVLMFLFSHRWQMCQDIIFWTVYWNFHEKSINACVWNWYRSGSAGSGSTCPGCRSRSGSDKSGSTTLLIKTVSQVLINYKFSIGIKAWSVTTHHPIHLWLVSFTSERNRRPLTWIPGIKRHRFMKVNMNCLEVLMFLNFFSWKDLLAVRIQPILFLTYCRKWWLV